MYRVFTRTWWKVNTDWHDGLESCLGPKTTLGYCATEEQARDMAQKWNKSHKPGPLSRKAEFEEAKDETIKGSQWLR